MAKNTLQLLLVLSTVLLFDFLFWEEKMGLNTLIFSVFYLGALWWAFPESRSSKGFWATAAGTLLTAGMVAWHNSAAAKFAWQVSALCVAGFAQEGQLRFVLFALLQYLNSFIFAIGSLLKAVNQLRGQRKGRGHLARWISLGWLPLLIALGFYVFYLIANPKFAELSGQFWDWVGSLIHFEFSFAHFVFVVFALFCCGGALLKHTNSLAADDAKLSDQLVRRRAVYHKPFLTFHFNGLRREYQQSVLVLVMLNALLLLVNLTDIRFVWFGFDQEVQSDLKSYVHAGTYLLIASILMAMAVLFFIFRKNLNFYPNNLTIKRLAAAWLVQNGVLALSVAVRTGRYVDFHGLAYKRIGVFLFLLLVFVGLVTLWLRIERRHSNFWLWRWNGWAAYALLALNACVGWDTLITSYNLSGRPRDPKIDGEFLIYRLSNKNVRQLEAFAATHNLANYDFGSMKAEDVEQGIQQKREQFDNQQRHLTWKSWNLADSGNK